jgi:hypothetical protein
MLMGSYVTAPSGHKEQLTLQTGQTVSMGNIAFWFVYHHFTIFKVSLVLIFLVFFFTGSLLHEVFFPNVKQIFIYITSHFYLRKKVITFFKVAQEFHF